MVVIRGFFTLLVGAVFLLALGGCAQQPSDIASVLQNPESFLDMQIRLQGTATPSLAVRCTKMFCPAENPCCNTCGAGLTLEDSTGIINLDSSSSCKGDDCALTCQPLENGKHYEITGTLQLENGVPTFFINHYSEINHE